MTFVTDSHGNVIEINGLQGSVEGNFENEISVNGKAIRLTGVSSIKVTSDGENITEISDVAGDLVTTDGNTYRKNVRVYELGGTEKLTTSADGKIIFHGNKFETSAGKTFALNEEGKISGIEKAQVDNELVSANVAELETSAENFATINLSTTDGLEEVSGNFSEGITVNGVFVQVTDSTNFVVKDDDENVYIETTAADIFTINDKTFVTAADKTIFKLDASGNVSEIVTDKFYLYPNENTYLIEGDFSDEIIFNGKKFCVTGTNDTTIFIGEETLIGVELARNSVEVVESGGAADIAVNGGGDITIGGKTFTTADDFIGLLRMNSSGEVEKLENFVGMLSGSISGLALAGLTIDSNDNFNVIGDGEKVTAIENLQNGSLTSDDLDAITINGEKISVDDSEEETLTITDGKLKSAEETIDSGTTAEEILESLGVDNPIIVNADNRNVTLSGGQAVVVEDTSAKVSITAGDDTIVSQGENVHVNLNKGGNTWLFAIGGKMTLEGYDDTTGAGFNNHYDDMLPEILNKISSKEITFDKGKLSIDSAVVSFGDVTSEIVNFYDANNGLQKIGFASDDATINANKKKENLILVGGIASTLLGGAGSDSIFADAGSYIDAGKGNNYIELDQERGTSDDGATIVLQSGKTIVENFNTGFEDSSDKILTDPNATFNTFDGENVTVKSCSARGLLQSISSGDDFVKILETDKAGNTYKVAIAQEGLIIAAGDDTADIYVGEKSGVDFTGYDESLTIDLTENFYGINRVTVGSGLNTLISSSRNETLTGNSDGITEFNFRAGGGRDLIQHFNFDEDKINVGTDAVTDVRLNSAGNVRLKVGGGEDWLTIEDAQGKNFKINSFIAKVDKNIDFDDAANYFVATARNASLTVDESAEIWLDGSHVKYFSGDIRTLDASTSTGKTELVGNDLDNTILAGNGDASLWGGNLGDDLLIGGAGKNIFFYTNGNGNDTIQGANNGDVVYLSQVSLKQIASTNITADSVSINFKDSGSLQVNSNADITYQLADGSKFSANHEQVTWIAK